MLHILFDIFLRAFVVLFVWFCLPIILLSAVLSLMSGKRNFSFDRSLRFCLRTLSHALKALDKMALQLGRIVSDKVAKKFPGGRSFVRNVTRYGVLLAIVFGALFALSNATSADHSLPSNPGAASEQSDRDRPPYLVMDVAQHGFADEVKRGRPAYCR